MTSEELRRKIEKLDKLYLRAAEESTRARRELEQAALRLRNCESDEKHLGERLDQERQALSELEGMDNLCECDLAHYRRPPDSARCPACHKTTIRPYGDGRVGHWECWSCDHGWQPSNPK